MRVRSSTSSRWWIDHRSDIEVLPISGSIDEAALAKLIEVYEDDALDTPPFDGAIVLEGTTPVAQYPTPGLGINRITAGPRVAAALLQDPRPEVRLDIVEISPVLPVSEVDNALREARLLLNGPIELTRTDPDATVILTEEQLALALLTRVERSPIARLVVLFDPAVIDSLLIPVRSQFEAPPRDAELTIDDEDNVVIIEGRPGALIDADLAAQAAEEAARRGTRTAELPFEDGALPTVTTEENHWARHHSKALRIHDQPLVLREPGPEHPSLCGCGRWSDRHARGRVLAQRVRR